MFLWKRAFDYRHLRRMPFPSGNVFDPQSGSAARAEQAANQFEVTAMTCCGVYRCLPRRILFFSRDLLTRLVLFQPHLQVL